MIFCLERRNKSSLDVRGNFQCYFVIVEKNNVIKAKMIEIKKTYTSMICSHEHIN